MLTRGHLIGQIVDDLATIAAQAKQRARLHLFDIHTYVEDFAKEVLNRTLGIELSNLNVEHSNSPGLDLGDATNGWAFQVTTDKSGEKVKDTLEKIEAGERNKYPNLRILVIGEKQGSYTFRGEPYESAGFTPEMVWDFNDVCKNIMSLPLEKLKDLADYISSETRRVRIELEIPDEDGQFATSIEHFIEAIPRPTLSNAAKMDAHFQKKYQVGSGRKEMEAAIKELSERLTKLPRLTREVFKFLVERKDDWKSALCDDFIISDPKLRRIYNGEDLAGDLALLSDASFISFNASGSDRDSDYWRIHFPGSAYNFNLLFIEYITDLNLNLRKPLVLLDFSDF